MHACRLPQRHRTRDGTVKEMDKKADGQAKQNHDASEIQPGSQARRNFLRVAGAAAATAGMSVDSALAAQSHLPAAAGAGAVPAFHGATHAPDAAPIGYNILFILTDQERHF